MPTGLAVGAVRGQLDSNSGALAGAWLRSNNEFIHYARINRAGNVGRGRIGAEANHVFVSLRQSLHDFGGSNVVFIGRAGAPGSSNNPDAIWLRANGQNMRVRSSHLKHCTHAGQCQCPRPLAHSARKQSRTRRTRSR